MDASAEPHVLLCDGCAEEVDAKDDDNLVPPGSELNGAACERCGALLVAFAYRVPESAYTGMAPGAG